MPPNYPLHHTARINGLLDELAVYLRSHIEKFDEPRARALFETAAQVLLRLRTAFKQYEDQEEKGTHKHSH